MHIYSYETQTLNTFNLPKEITTAQHEYTRIFPLPRTITSPRAQLTKSFLLERYLTTDRFVHMHDRDKVVKIEKLPALKLSVFNTCVYARKSLNLCKCYPSNN